MSGPQTLDITDALSVAGTYMPSYCDTPTLPWTRVQALLIHTHAPHPLSPTLTNACTHAHVRAHAYRGSLPLVNRHREDTMVYTVQTRKGINVLMAVSSVSPAHNPVLCPGEEADCLKKVDLVPRKLGKNFPTPTK